MPMEAEYATILYETADHAAWITLNRPESGTRRATSSARK